MSELRVVLVDDHAVVRDGLRFLINAQRDMVVVGVAEDGEAAVRVAVEQLPDVIVMDVSLPLQDGAEAATQIKQLCPGVGVLALTRHSDPGSLRRMLRAGATGYVVKKSAGDQLISAIRTVASGSVYIDPSMTEDLVQAVVREQPAAAGEAHSPLTDRETHVLRLIAWGLSNKEIAGKLGLSVKTVEYYKAAATHKLGFHSRTEIVRYALARGWLRNEQAPE
jgi:DNA-binding NarL/FixJ family response regulator